MNRIANFLSIIAFLLPAFHVGASDEISAVEPMSKVAPPANAKVQRDVAYGPEAAQRMDVYAPREAKKAPIILMVHGGGWRYGDKNSAGVVENKIARWLPRGVIIVSANYRMLPKTDPLEQANDVARALATVQQRATAWGGDPTRIVLMGHSAGAHLVALLAADPAIAAAQGAKPWLGTIPLDSAALDVTAIMGTKHLRLYDNAFGSKSEYWRSASPLHRLTGTPAPMLIVCSSKRSQPCPEARQFAEKAAVTGGKVTVLPVALSHAAVNRDLGTAGVYTDGVETFLRSLNVLE